MQELNSLDSDNYYQGRVGIEDTFQDDSMAVHNFVEESSNPSKKRKGAETSTPNFFSPVQEDLEDEPEKQKGKEPSWVWDHFTIKSIQGINRVVCNWCETASYKCVTKRNGTTNMGNHLRNQCKKFPKQLDPKQKVLAFQPIRK